MAKRRSEGAVVKRTVLGIDELGRKLLLTAECRIRTDYSHCLLASEVAFFLAEGNYGEYAKARQILVTILGEKGRCFFLYILVRDLLYGYGAEDDPEIENALGAFDVTSIGELASRVSGCATA